MIHPSVFRAVGTIERALNINSKCRELSVVSTELNIARQQSCLSPISPCCGHSQCSGAGWDINHTLTSSRRNGQTLNGCGTEENLLTFNGYMAGRLGSMN